MRHHVLTAIVDRLSAIRVSSGFETDAGATIVIGEAPELGDGDPDEALAVDFGEDSAAQLSPGVVLMTTPVVIRGVAKATPDDPFAQVEAVLADIKRAVELPDRSLGNLVSQIQRGVTRAVPREAGASTAGVAITYVLTWKEGWGGA